MKKIILPAPAMLIIVASCSHKKQYTQNSPEIDTYKKVIGDYENRN